MQETTYESDGHATSVITATETKSVEAGNIKAFYSNTPKGLSKLTTGMQSPNNSSLRYLVQKR